MLSNQVSQPPVQLPNRRWRKVVFYSLLILAMGILLALPFAIPYFSTRPLSRDQLMRQPVQH